MPKVKVCNLVVKKTGLFSLVERISYSQSLPLSATIPLRDLREILDSVVENERLYGTKKALNSVCRIVYRKATYLLGLNPYTGYENRLINMDNENINLLTYLSYIIRSENTVFIDSAYLDKDIRTELYLMCDYLGVTICHFDVFNINDNDNKELEGYIAKTIASNGVILCTNSQHSSVNKKAFNKFMDRNILNYLGKAHCPLYYVTDVHTALDYSTLDFLVRNRKSLNITFIAQTTTHDLAKKIEDGWIQNFDEYQKIMSCL